jgi:hypothetical protein
MKKRGVEQGDFFSSNDSQNTEYGKILFQYINPDFKVRLHAEILLAASRAYAGQKFPRALVPMAGNNRGERTKCNADQASFITS